MRSLKGWGCQGEAECRQLRPETRPHKRKGAPSRTTLQQKFLLNCRKIMLLHKDVANRQKVCGDTHTAKSGCGRSQNKQNINYNNNIIRNRHSRTLVWGGARRMTTKAKAIELKKETVEEACNTVLEESKKSEESGQ